MGRGAGLAVSEYTCGGGGTQLPVSFWAGQRLFIDSSTEHSLCVASSEGPSCCDMIYKAPSPQLSSPLLCLGF